MEMDQVVFGWACLLVAIWGLWGLNRVLHTADVEAQRARYGQPADCRETSSEEGKAEDRPKLVAFLVHGTWGRGIQLPLLPLLVPSLRLRERARWTEPGQVLAAKLDRVFEVEYQTPPWSGGNTTRTRLDAAADLAACLSESCARQPLVPHVVVAHSHGGNVALYAISSMEANSRRSLAGLITIATPFLGVGAARRWPVLAMQILLAGGGLPAIWLTLLAARQAANHFESGVAALLTMIGLTFLLILAVWFVVEGLPAYQEQLRKRMAVDVGRLPVVGLIPTLDEAHRALQLGWLLRETPTFLLGLLLLPLSLLDYVPSIVILFTLIWLTPDEHWSVPDGWSAVLVASVVLLALGRRMFGSGLVESLLLRIDVSVEAHHQVFRGIRFPVRRLWGRHFELHSTEQAATTIVREIQELVRQHAPQLAKLARRADKTAS